MSWGSAAGLVGAGMARAGEPDPGEAAASAAADATRALAARLAARVHRRTSQRQGWPSVMFIDGRSGSGKTTLAEAVAAELTAAGCTPPRVIGMDELYPGWDGLAAGSASVAGMLRSGRYQRYDWYAEDFAPEIALDPGAPLIIEGCGSLTPESLAAARELGEVYTVWIECPAPLRRSRALARDGDMFAPHWDSWASQEAVHFARAQPVARVDEMLHVGGGTRATDARTSSSA